MFTASRGKIQASYKKYHSISIAVLKAKFSTRNLIKSPSIVNFYVKIYSKTGMIYFRAFTNQNLLTQAKKTALIFHLLPRLDFALDLFKNARDFYIFYA